MKIRVLMATLVITLMLGVQSFANPCDSACVDPCAACNGNAKTCNMFSGLKKLVNGARFNNCDPCDPVVACNPCDIACDQPRVGLGGRLRNLFADRGYNTDCGPCDITGDCGFDDSCAPCDPCGLGGDDSCNTSCGRRFSFPKLNLFGNRGNNCGPCDEVGDCGFDDNCNPCDPCGLGGDDSCNTSCRPRNCLIDLPRLGLGKLFGGLRGGCDTGCEPCGDLQDCLPCDNACLR